ncbi:uncharacterized protein LOC131929849 isoform X2 [Physella acuta]|uniref:uncharacterized protein LOC131929849 isoform X2 n=1 Tax=Physella acuta TaxID=109671 RepID=UPI0027DB1772|nr:uncharacterized protein LOC131929849 isoform X2 [Physella acuta]
MNLYYTYAGVEKMESCLTPKIESYIEQLTVMSETAQCEWIKNTSKTCLIQVYGDNKPSDEEVDEYTIIADTMAAMYNPNCQFDIHLIVQEIWPQNKGSNIIQTTDRTNVTMEQKKHSTNQRVAVSRATNKSKEKKDFSKTNPDLNKSPTVNPVSSATANDVKVSQQKTIILAVAVTVSLIFLCILLIVLLKKILQRFNSQHARYIHSI